MKGTGPTGGATIAKKEKPQEDSGEERNGTMTTQKRTKETRDNTFEVQDSPALDEPLTDLFLQGLPDVGSLHFSN